MTKSLLLGLKFLFLILVLLLSFKLRWTGYSLVPLPGQSLDEYSYSWVGLSLIRLGLPVGISGMPGYKFNDLRYINVDRVFQSTARGNPVSINYPWFDHPPLLGLVSGGYAYLKGAEVFEDTIASTIRRPIIYFGIVSVLLVFILGWLNYGYMTGIIAALVYGTFPLVVISSRMIQAENGFIPFLLATLICISMYFRHPSRFWLVLAALFAGICTLFKVSGLVAILAILPPLYLYHLPDRRLFIYRALIFLGVSLSLFSLYFIFGMIYDPVTFINVFMMNSTRFYGIGPAALNNLLTETRITQDKTMADAWPLAMWISFFISLAHLEIDRKHLPDILLTSTTVCYLLIYIVFGSQPYGWYALPFWPILTLIFARLLTRDLFNPRHLLQKIILLSFPITLLITKMVDIKIFQAYANYWRLGIGILLLYLLWQTFISKSPKSKIALLFTIGLLLVCVYLNTVYLKSLTIDNWYRVN